MVYICNIGKNKCNDKQEPYALSMLLFDKIVGGVNTPQLSFSFSLDETKWQCRELKKYFKNDNHIVIICNDYDKLNQLMHNEINYINGIDKLN